jgi:hypothetical protein
MNFRCYEHLVTDINNLPQAAIMEEFGLQGLVINSDTIQEVQSRKEDLWKQAEKGPNILFMAQEQQTCKMSLHEDRSKV